MPPKAPLPTSPPAPDAIPRDAAAAGTDATGDPAKVGVALVDDHSVMRQGLAALINAEPDLYVCGEAGGVREALAVVAATNPKLVVVDLSLPDGDGLELIKDLRARHPGLLTLVLSMYDETVYAERALRAGASGYIRKVEASDKVMGAIRRVLGGRVYLSEDAAANVIDRVVGGGGGAGAKSTEAAPSVDRLSDRELQVLRSIGRGSSNRQIAEELFISVKTVEAHREHIKQKLHLASSADLLRYAIQFCRTAE